MNAEKGHRKWTIRPVQEGDDKLIETLYLESKGKFDRRKWEHRFKNLPAAKEGMFYHLAVAGDRCAGQYAVQPHYYTYRGEQIIGAHSLETLTHPEFRKQGVFTALATSVYDQLKSAKVPFVFGFPNRNSAPGFIHKLGWIRIRPGFHLVCPLGVPQNDRIKLPKGVIRLSDQVFRLSRRAVAGGLRELSKPLKPNLSVREVDGIPEDMDQLWGEVSRTANIVRVRDRKYLTWRYAEKGKYTFFEVRSHDELVGMAVIGMTSDSGYRLASVLELVVKPGQGWVLLALLNAVTNQASEMKVHFLQAYCPPSRWEFRWYLSAGFVWLPDKYFSHSAVKAACYLGVSKPVADELCDSTNWFLSLGDHD